MTSLFDRFRLELRRSLSGEPRRVLVAEDYADLANVIATLLRHCGFDVRTARDGLLVLAMARSFRPHYILLDVRMPGLGGYEVAELLRKEAGMEGLIIIGISAYRPAPPADLYFDHYLVKPFELETLLALFGPD